jgi:hypothetical protein
MCPIKQRRSLLSSLLRFDCQITGLTMSARAQTRTSACACAFCDRFSCVCVLSFIQTYTLMTSVTFACILFHTRRAGKGAPTVRSRVAPSRQRLLEHLLDFCCVLVDMVAHEKLARSIFDKPDCLKARHPTWLGQQSRLEEHVACLDLFTQSLEYAPSVKTRCVRHM